MNITKVELFWSRECPYVCTGCAMPNSLRGGSLRTKDGGTPAEWRDGVARMASLGSKFVVIYGAEPLQRPEGLPDVVKEIYAQGMKATIITALPRSRKLADLLAASPLDSVTVSWESEYLDKYRQKKSTDGWEMIHSNVLKNLPDRAVVATVTRLNADQMPDMAARANADGIWFLFDLFHYGHSILSKCSIGRIDPLCPTRPQVVALAKALKEMKQGGARIHASAEYFDMLIADYTGDPRASWHCVSPETEDVLGWLTVDSDGRMLACEDWQVPFPESAKIWDDSWTNEQMKRWMISARRGCAGCVWNHHFDALAIEKGGGVDTGTYVHQRA